MSELKATTAQEIVRNEKDCDYMDELFGGVKMPPTQVYLKSEADKVIAELKQEIEHLKKQSSCTFSEDCLQVRQLRAENHRLKRALYKACANWACTKMEYEQFGSNVYMLGVATEKEVSWESMMKKCQAKAEEYK